jgi:hypothetical protein
MVTPCFFPVPHRRGYREKKDRVSPGRARVVGPRSAFCIRGVSFRPREQQPLARDVPGDL